jgi:hypothetical protein
MQISGTSLIASGEIAEVMAESAICRFHAAHGQGGEGPGRVSACIEGSLPLALAALTGARFEYRKYLIFV